MNDAVERIIEASRNRDHRLMRRVSFVNADCLNKAVTDRHYHHILNSSWLVLPDGIGLRIASHLLRMPLRDNVNGTDLFPLLCERAAITGTRLLLLGGKPGVASAAADNMRQRFADLNIVGCLDGYAESADTAKTLSTINAARPDVILVGLGAPTQERWLHEHQTELNAAVGIGVGGLFDYYSGRIKRAPLSWRRAGVEWVWRILQEPRAKWRRYVVGNPAFLLRIFAERRRVNRLPSRGQWLQEPVTPANWARVHAESAAQPRLPAVNYRHRFLRRQFARTALKRVFDVCIAASAIVLLAPLLLLTALAIRLESPGPILFSQQRVGYRGRLFSMLKFRSMYEDAEARLASLAGRNESRGGVLFKMKQDPRVTRIGRIIRRLSIDELPQILNVLRGDMSIVGPRPALPSEVANYSAADRKRLQTKPGLTCYWQIGGRSDLSFEQQVALDCKYLSQQSVVTDIEIVAKTVPAVMGGKGAY
ncbi:MAG: WecB/TagA/CpsF family glycosyltransferase [Pseudomonadota bacterium]